jgi:hypothetical protein
MNIRQLGKDLLGEFSNLAPVVSSSSLVLLLHVFLLLVVHLLLKTFSNNCKLLSSLEQDYQEPLI